MTPEADVSRFPSPSTGSVPHDDNPVYQAVARGATSLAIGGVLEGTHATIAV
jgi:hypothetical protein